MKSADAQAILEFVRKYGQSFAKEIGDYLGMTSQKVANTITSELSDEIASIPIKKQDSHGNKIYHLYEWKGGLPIVPKQFLFRTYAKGNYCSECRKWFSKNIITCPDCNKPLRKHARYRRTKYIKDLRIRAL